MPIKKTVWAVYHALSKEYGDCKNWWPADHAFEVMVGAILAQNTSWACVEKAIARLRERDYLFSPDRLIKVNRVDLEYCLRPSGYYRLKTQRLLAYCHWYLKEGGYEALRQWPTELLRVTLLGVNGIGPETADDILLYAFKRPVFVIDAYTRRLGARLAWVNGKPGYLAWQRWFEQALNLSDQVLYAHYHALIVIHAKARCRESKPVCDGCVLRVKCYYSACRKSEKSTVEPISL